VCAVLSNIAKLIEKYIFFLPYSRKSVANHQIFYFLMPIDFVAALSAKYDFADHTEIVARQG
jgi:hypothetical protein